jgi:hypothetical protein
VSVTTRAKRLLGWCATVVIGPALAALLIWSASKVSNAATQHEVEAKVQAVRQESRETYATKDEVGGIHNRLGSMDSKLDVLIGRTN